jgi:hypothetical protein
LIRMDKTVLLFLSASSKEARKPGEDEDVPFVEACRDIEGKIGESRYRDSFKVVPGYRVSLDELHKLLDRERPQIVHFFGHGAPSFLLLEDEQGKIEEAKLSTFAETFRLLNERDSVSPEEKIRCVVLVACNSKKIAAAISEYVECAIGMTFEIPVPRGREFAKNFYYYLCNGNSVKWAFDYACSAAGFGGEEDPKRPVLIHREDIHPDKIYFVPNEFAKYSGTWEGIHLSKDRSGATVFSRHHYNIDVTPDGQVRGTCDEVSADPPYKYNVKGEIKSESIFWAGDIQGTPSYGWFFTLFNQNAIPGFIFSRDFDGREFASIIILSRKRLDDMEYLNYLKEAKKKFYLSK